MKDWTSAWFLAFAWENWSLSFHQWLCVDKDSDLWQQKTKDTPLWHLRQLVCVGSEAASIRESQHTGFTLKCYLELLFDVFLLDFNPYNYRVAPVFLIHSFFNVLFANNWAISYIQAKLKGELKKSEEGFWKVWALHAFANTTRKVYFFQAPKNKKNQYIK